MNIKGTGDARFDQALRKLRGALVGLEGTEGRTRARRNARQRVLGALRALRADLDTRFPVVRAEGKTRTVLDYDGRVHRARRQGWVEIEWPAEVATFAAAGIRVLQIKGTNVRPHPSFTHKTVKTKHESLWVPSWAVAIGAKNTSALRRARKDITFRKAAIAADTLQNSV